MIYHDLGTATIRSYSVNFTAIPKSKALDLKHEKLDNLLRPF